MAARFEARAERRVFMKSIVIIESGEDTWACEDHGNDYYSLVGHDQLHHISEFGDDLIIKEPATEPARTVDISINRVTEALQALRFGHEEVKAMREAMLENDFSLINFIN